MSTDPLPVDMTREDVSAKMLENAIQEVRYLERKAKTVFDNVIRVQDEYKSRGVNIQIEMEPGLYNWLGMYRVEDTHS